MTHINIVFDGPPSHESGRFVEVEDYTGRSINAGEWLQRPDGYWVLRLPAPETETVSDERDGAVGSASDRVATSSSSDLVKALEEIAKQELSADMSVDDQLGGDFEGAYNHIIELARSALRSHRGEKEEGWLGRGINDPDAGA